MNLFGKTATTRIRADKEISVRQLVKAVNEFLVKRGDRDIGRILACMAKVSWKTNPSQCMAELWKLGDLWHACLLLAPNTMLPRKRLAVAIMEVHTECGAILFVAGDLENFAGEVGAHLRRGLSKLRTLAHPHFITFPGRCGGIGGGDEGGWGRGHGS